ncbi:hypothetical protein SNE40_008692 [Patella caerulea]|uniref:CARD domain-containing protein n=1 Tax=Patella caerulea TaxID=87958 RepID=A0AAN8PP10_PATCE
MDPKHRAILKQKNIRKDLNLKDGLFTQLITRKLLNQRMVRRIKNIRSTDKQANEVLDILQKRGPECFDLFCEALIADDQGSFVTEYLKPKSSEKVSALII